MQQATMTKGEEQKEQTVTSTTAAAAAIHKEKILLLFCIMGGKIPPAIKNEVIRQWLNGDSRDQIAKDKQIGAGTVSTIIKEIKQRYNNDESEFDLLRQVALILKREGLDLGLFASSIRLRRKLQDKGLNQDQIESFIENMDVHCFNS